VAGKSQEVASKRLNVNGEMRHRLRGIYKNERSGAMSFFADFFNAVDSTEDVRDVCESDEFRPP
jgi:hypothetical protein